MFFDDWDMDWRNTYCKFFPRPPMGTYLLLNDKKKTISGNTLSWNPKSFNKNNSLTFQKAWEHV